MARLYISGPVTGIEDDNREAFEEAKRRLHRKFDQVSIPHNYIDAGTSWPKAMRISIYQIIAPRTLGLALLPGWKRSKGARLEKAVAEACGIPVKTVDEWMEEYCERRKEAPAAPVGLGGADRDGEERQARP